MGFEIKIESNGRILLPLALRRELGVENGGTLQLEVEEDGLVLRTRRQMARRAQTLVREFLGDYKGNLVDELSADRREEARGEEEELGG